MQLSEQCHNQEPLLWFWFYCRNDRHISFVDGERPSRRWVSFGRTKERIWEIGTIRNRSWSLKAALMRTIGHLTVATGRGETIITIRGVAGTIVIGKCIDVEWTGRHVSDIFEWALRETALVPSNQCGCGRSRKTRWTTRRGDEIQNWTVQRGWCTE